MSLSKYLNEYLSDSESGEVSSSDEETNTNQKLTRGLPSTCLSFSANLSRSLSKMTPYRVIIFDNVDVNRDNAYSVTTGRFTAPYKGQYVFLITVTSTERLRPTLCLIYKFHPVEQTKVKERERRIEGFYTKTSAVMLNLDKADEVWVLNVTKVSDVGKMVEPYYSTFSGGLVEKLNN